MRKRNHVILKTWMHVIIITILPDSFCYPVVVHSPSPLVGLLNFTVLLPKGPWISGVCRDFCRLRSFRRCSPGTFSTPPVGCLNGRGHKGIGVESEGGPSSFCHQPSAWTTLSASQMQLGRCSGLDSRGNSEGRDPSGPLHQVVS
jgi:hypothetical protein